MWTLLKRQLWRARGVLITTPLVAGTVIGMRLLGALQFWELVVLDQFIQFRPPEAADSRIVLVQIDENDLRQIGQWPIPDRALAQMLNLIKQQQPRAIGLDVYRDIPAPPGHEELVKVFESTPNLIGIQKVVGESTKSSVNPPPALEKRDQIGSNDLLTDPDGKLRRILLSLKDKDSNTILSLGAQLAIMYLDVEGVTVQNLDPKGHRVQLGKAVFEPMQATDGGYVDLDEGGYQILANFRNLRSGFPTISIMDVLQERMPKDFVRDRIVLIGMTAESAGDYFFTPYTVEQIHPTVVANPVGGGVSGVAIHGDVASQLISAALEGRPQIKVWSDSVEYFWIGTWAMISAVICWIGRYRGLARRSNAIFTWKSLPLTGMTLVAIAAGLVYGSYLAFLQTWWIPVLPAFLAILGSTGVITGYSVYTATEMRRTFGRYLTDEVVATLLETPEGLKLGGERRRVTILISDLRGFSAISEQVSPEIAMSVVNQYLESMTSVIYRYQGTINELMGDGIFVIFGAPIRRDNDAQRAVACAIAMQQAMVEVNRKLANLQLPQLEMGIGIHTGEVLAGNLGSQQRAKYTVLGSTVNLASRIESYTVGGQILISDNTAQNIGDILQLDGLLQMRAKGIREPINLYDVKGIQGEFRLALPKEEITLVSLFQPIPVQCRLVTGKTLTDDLFTGKLTKLSDKLAELQTNHPLELLANLVINLMLELENATEVWDIYAKVVEISHSNLHHYHIRFTSVPPAIANLFQHLQVEGSRK